MTAMYQTDKIAGEKETVETFSFADRNLSSDPSNRTYLEIQNYFSTWYLNTESPEKPEIEKKNSSTSTIPYQQSIKRIVLADKIYKLWQNPDNWDGYGTPRVSEKLKIKCFEILNSVCKHSFILPNIFPVCGGGLLFEWELGKRELEIEFNEESISVLRTEERKANKFKYIEEEDVSINELPGMIEWLLNI